MKDTVQKEGRPGEALPVLSTMGQMLGQSLASVEGAAGGRESER